MGVSHSETLTVTLTAERGKGYGLSVCIGEHSDDRPADILISRILPDSSAYRYKMSVYSNKNCFGPNCPLLCFRLIFLEVEACKLVIE